VSIDSGSSSYRFVRIDEFTPESHDAWTSFGAATRCDAGSDGRSFSLTGTSPGEGLAAPVLKIFVLGPSCVRVRFNPMGRYDKDGSYAVVNQNFGAFTPITETSADGLVVALGDATLDVRFAPLQVRMLLDGQVISTDTERGIVYLPGNQTGREAVANFKALPNSAHCFGMGEKGGPTLCMRGTSLTFFNYDNYKYSGGNSGPTAVVPPDQCPGPLNSSEPLYNSIPFLIVDDQHPSSGPAYAYGLLFDNEAQSYFNLGAGGMQGQYYFGALYGEIDYYLMVGRNTAEVLKQFITLTGPPAMPPMWALGYHQGCYGYYDHAKVLTAAQAYRQAKIPIDGIHIDVDFQNNYRTFTASPAKFPSGGRSTFAALSALGIKASTNVTGIVTAQPLDEDGQASPYSVLDEGKQIGAFFQDVRAEAPDAPSPGLYFTNESYGCNFNGFNPYPSPGAPLEPNCSGVPLGTYGFYADLGRPEIRTWWGKQYAPLLDAGLEMVWQDMTDPATQRSVSDTMPWKTLALDLMVYDHTADGMVPHAHIHNVFALNLISATYEGLIKLRKDAGVDRRPFIIARGGYTGVHRYAASWTGDSASDWNFLSILIPEILNFGLSGQSMAGADVGGFAVSSTGDAANGTGADGITDAELLVRWTQLSSFIGWFRNHYDGYNKKYQEPYAYAEPVPTICRQCISLRYTLLQIFYDAMFEAGQSGLPICRPLFLTDGHDPAVYNKGPAGGPISDQFLVGANLLVAPVIQRGQTSRDVYLPGGSSWYAYQSNAAPLQGPSLGGQSIRWYTPLDIVPLYVRAGAIVARRQLEQYVGELASNPITLDIYPGPDSTHTLYLDDKVGVGATDHLAFRTVQVSQTMQTGATRVQTVRLLRTHDQFTPAEDCYYVAFLDTPEPISVSAGDETVPIGDAVTDDAGAAQLTHAEINAACYNHGLRTALVKLFDAGPDLIVTAVFPVS
jgi:alpha-glucosidase